GKNLERLPHTCDRPAEHGLYGIGGERMLNWNYTVDVGKILFQPALTASIQFIHVLEHQCAFRFFVESQDGIAPELPHAAAQFPAGLRRQHVAMESFSSQ